jgi:hypothetical protein
MHYANEQHSYRMHYANEQHNYANEQHSYRMHYANEQHSYRCPPSCPCTLPTIQTKHCYSCPPFHPCITPCTHYQTLLQVPSETWHPVSRAVLSSPMTPPQCPCSCVSYTNSQSRCVDLPTCLHQCLCSCLSNYSTSCRCVVTCAAVH